MSQVNGFKGFVGYSIRELSLNETNDLCKNDITIKTDSFLLLLHIQNHTNFTSDFMIRSYSSGCYYYDTETGKWKSEGMEIYEDTNLKQTHCLSNHLTSFAGGLNYLPSTINFHYVFDNASFSSNPIIYSSVILITFVYILFAILSRYKDMRDEKKMNLVLLKDNVPSDTFFYEIIVFTGNRSESGSQSKVKLFCFKKMFKIYLFNNLLKRFILL